ncbi:MAG: HPr(Ser) kinase/phosphatase [Elusimicrobiota bacterium]|jgi:HPr kinase/phosphorylase
MAVLLVADIMKEKQTDLDLTLLAGSKGIRRVVTVSEINRPGLAISGYLDYFPSERVQIIGLGEHSYLATLPLAQRVETLRRVLSYNKNLPCIVMTRGLKPHRELVKVADQLKVPLLRSGLTTAHLIGELTVYLEEKLAPTSTIHGVLMNVYGLGVLLVGDSGIGKSECALELLKRGHMLVADDVVEIKQRLGGLLFGTGAELIRHHMELRGLGIIDVQKVFGVSSILDRTRIELVIRLEEWKQTVAYDRVGLSEEVTSILGVRIPEIVMPVRPGRNLAVLVEVATLNQRLKYRGQYTAREFNKRLIAMMAKKSAKKPSGQKTKP